MHLTKFQVRLILRNLGGKACWDTSLLYGLKDDVSQLQQAKSYSNQQQPKLSSATRGSQQNEQLFGTSSFIGTDLRFILIVPFQKLYYLVYDMLLCINQCINLYQKLLCRIDNALKINFTFNQYFSDHPSPPRLSVRHRPPNCMPKWEDTAEDMDNIEDVYYVLNFAASMI